MLTTGDAAVWLTAWSVVTCCSFKDEKHLVFGFDEFPQFLVDYLDCCIEQDSEDDREWVYCLVLGFVFSHTTHGVSILPCPRLYILTHNTGSEYTALSLALYSHTQPGVSILPYPRLYILTHNREWVYCLVLGLKSHIFSRELGWSLNTGSEYAALSSAL